MRTRIRFRFLLAAFAVITGALTNAPGAYADHPIVDLHAHLFFYEGSGTSLLGNFTTPIRVRSAEDRIGSKANASALESSGAKIVVVALYAHPLFLVSCRDSIRKQIDAAEAFVATHSDWAIAKSAEQASELVHADKRILILSLEGASCVLENESDLEEFIDRRGVRIVTPVHFTDDWVGGASLMPGVEILTNPWAALKSLFSPHLDRYGALTHEYGLGTKGKWLIESLLKRGVWIDLAHTSDGTYEALTPWLEKAHQPFLYTHTVLREYYQAERAITPERLEKVRQTEGIIGILPSADMLKGTKINPVYCPAICDESCDGGIPLFLTQYSEAVSVLKDSASVMIGSDINAPLDFLGPACPQQAKQGYKGLVHYGQLAELWKSAHDLDLVPRESNAWAERFLSVWSRVKALN
jgi:microsomal dipeptidase-like Zn-dependent dipeptidase